MRNVSDFLPNMGLFRKKCCVPDFCDWTPILCSAKNQKMKHLYQCLFLLSILTMICTMIYPPLHGYSIERRLLAYSTAWTLNITTPDRTLAGWDEENSKAQLLAFLKQNRQPTSPLRIPLASGALVAAILSAIGWRRENYLIKRAEPTAAASPSVGR